MTKFGQYISILIHFLDRNDAVWTKYLQFDRLVVIFGVFSHVTPVAGSKIRTSGSTAPDPTSFVKQSNR